MIKTVQLDCYHGHGNFHVYTVQRLAYMQPDADVAPREFWGYQMHDLERTVYASYRLHSLLLFPECVYIHNPKPMFSGD